MTRNVQLTTMCAVWLVLAVAVAAQAASDYDALVQKGKAQLQAGGADLALASGEAAIKMNADRWEAYVLAGGALMNLKRYEDAADKLSEAIKRAPEAKQTALRDLRRQCLLAESGTSPAPKEAAPATATQAEIVLWKSIENSSNPADFQSYLDQYPHGAFVVLAQRHLAETKEAADRGREQQKQYALQHGSDLFDTIWRGGLINRKSGLVDSGLLIRFSADGKVISYSCYVRKKICAQIDADAQNLSKDAFIAKYLLSDNFIMTWSMDNGILRMTLPESKDGCPANYFGTRTGDTIKGTVDFPETGGRWSGCAHDKGEFQFQLLHLR